MKRPANLFRGFRVRSNLNREEESTLKIAKLIALASLLAMTGVLIYGFTVGDFFTEGAMLLAMPWGIVSLVDLYGGFALFSCWIVFREKALFPSVIWVILMLVLRF